MGVGSFAQFFIAPLFTPSATDREMQAVHNEHTKNAQSDSWRLNQLVRGADGRGRGVCSLAFLVSFRYSCLSCPLQLLPVSVGSVVCLFFV